MKAYDWTSQIKPLYDKALARYQAGHRDPQTLFEPAEEEILKSIGATAMELYDYAEDADALPWETALLILAARRDYFLVMHNGVHSKHRISMNDLHAKTDEMEGIPWLPRIIKKAEARLRGELPRELMYSCGGDRAFLQKHDIHPADFLRAVWAADGDHKKIVTYVKNSANR